MKGTLHYSLMFKKSENVHLEGSHAQTERAFLDMHSEYMTQR